ncbi:mitochondrial hydrolase YKR070W [Typha angustifolia]|uniref:mitochondrial hydrolase YKR070W n=1 Tax=Typha angustifolia TaxID=59011 RepID=UPI003C2ACC9A
MRRFQFAIRASQSQAKISRNFSDLCRRSYSQIQPQSERPSFGIAFDIDGVILRGSTPIGGSPQALRRLYHEDGTLKIPFLFLTNGGGVPESKRASELSELLGVHISPLQVVQGHSPFREMVNRFKDELIVAVGKGEPANVMSEYGFRKVLSIDEYASYFSGIDPLSSYKTWGVKQPHNKKCNSEDTHPRFDVYLDRVKGVFVVSDPVDWGRDIQVLCDILRTGGLPGKERGHQPPLYFASDDLEYQAVFPSERLGMGAFRIALESIFNTVHDNPLEYMSIGKPNPFVFKNAEAVLAKLISNIYHVQDSTVEGRAHSFNTFYMIGDNPKVDINGATKAGRPWFSILTRTGVFRGKDNHTQFPADMVVDTVEEAIDHILRKECK